MTKRRRLLRQRPQLHLAVAAALGIAAGCEQATSVALFPGPDAEIVYGQAPFPSDLFLDESGHIGPMPGIESAVRAETDTLRWQLAQLDGFGTRPVIELFLSAPIDVDTLPARTDSVDDAVFVVDTVSGDVAVVDWRFDAQRNAIVGAVARGVVLTEGTLHAAVVTNRIRGVGGALALSDGLRQVRDTNELDLPRPWRSTKHALLLLPALGVDAGAVVGVAAFTTQRPRDALLRARASLDERAAPTVRFDDADVIFNTPERLRALLGEPRRDADGEARLGWSFVSGMAHDHVAALGTGVLAGAITFRRVELDGDGADMPESGTWAIDGATGAPVVDRDVELPISFAVPSGAMPASGWPVAIVAHGLGGSRAQMHAFIDTLAREGYATVAIDADGHGMRHTARDEVNNIGERLTAQFGEGFAGVRAMRDGFGDVEGNGSAFDLFHGFKNIAAMRDQMRQSVIDLSQVVRAIQGGVDLSPLVPGATLDASRIAYLGESFGGVLGAVFLAVEPDVHLFYLDVPGGGIMEYVATNSPEISGVANLFVPATYSLDEGHVLSRFDTIIGLGSAVFEGTDPLSYAPRVLRNQDQTERGGRALGARHVVLGCVIGDEVLPNSATHALARALDVPLLGPSPIAPEGLDVVTGALAGNVEGQTAAIVHFSPANHGDNWTKEIGRRRFQTFTEDDTQFTRLDADERVVNPVRSTHEQVRRLLRDHRDGAVPTLVLTDLPRLPE